MLQLRILTLGVPEIRLGGNLVTFPTRKTLALLIYLALESGLQPREHLATLLWPESNTERSYASLRNTLGHLQTALQQRSGEGQTSYLYVTHTALGLNPEANIDLDLKIVERAYALARADRASRVLLEGSASLPTLQLAVDSHHGDFLVGFSLGDAPGFDDWAALQREVWRRRLGLVMDRLSEIQFASGEFADAAETASHWISLDVLNEVAYRRKMRAHFAAGDRGQALGTFAACSTILATELGVEPEPDTTALAERIRTHARPTPAHIHRSAPRLPRPDTSVAFLESLFVGRTSERLILEKSYNRAATANQAQIVVLRGEAGIGKTRLAREFLTWARAQGADLLQCSAFESSSHLPFQALAEAFRLQLEGENLPADLLDDVWWSPLSELLPELHQHYPSLPLAPMARHGPEAGVGQARLFEPLVQLTLAMAKRAPLVLFMDDLQWADGATLDFLLYAIRRWRDSAARILLLVSLRSEALQPVTQPPQAGGPTGLIEWLTRIEHELAVNHLDLKPLGESETMQMVLSILVPRDADFARWLYAETHGQPFYLMETLKDLLERRVLHPKRRAEGQWTFAVDADHNLGQAVRVPSTVHAVIRSRLNRLSPNAFSFLASAAILEQHITFDRLIAISNVTEDLALPALDELISGRLLLEAVHPGLDSAYAFANDMLRDVVYTEAGDARRRLFHRRALEILEAEGESAAVLAHHALAAGVNQAAFHHSLAAGSEALRLSATSEAIVHFEHARQIVQQAAAIDLPEKADLLDLYSWLGQAYELVGQAEKALAVDIERGLLGIEK
jgi:DNA-binding SARP family transcriptional activator